MNDESNHADGPSNPLDVLEGKPDFNSGLLGMVGARLVDATADLVVMEVPITPALYQPYGIVHGGLYCTMVETAGGLGAAIWYRDRGQVVGVGNHTQFFRAAREGILVATGVPAYRGRTAQVWVVEIVDEQERLVARGELRSQNISSTDHLGNH